MFISQGSFSMMSTGLFSINGILTFIAMNFYLVSDAWSRVAGLLATSFSIFLLSVILPNSDRNKVVKIIGPLHVSIEYSILNSRNSFSCCLYKRLK